MKLAKNLLIALTTACALVLALGLVGCGVTQSSKEAVPEVFQEGPCYRIVSTTSYNLDGGRYYKERNSYDEHGNLLTRDVTFAQGETSHSEYAGYDEYGYHASMVQDGVETTYEWVVEDGHAVSMTSSAGAQATYEYHPNGALSKTTSTLGDATYEYTYNESGRPVEMVCEGGSSPFSVKYKWSVDDQGQLESCWVKTSYMGSNTFTFEFDENGNIARILNEDGVLYRELEYQLFEDPSNQARIEAQQLPLP